MPITIKEACEIILDDINKIYTNITDFKIVNAKYYSGIDSWSIDGTFNYKITNKINGIKFSYSIDYSKISSKDFYPRWFAKLRLNWKYRQNVKR